MKRRTFSTLAAIALCALTISSCGPDQGSPVGTDQQLLDKSAAPATPASPVIVYKTKTTISRTSYASLAVMDADGSHKANIYTVASATAGLGMYASATWAPGGSGTAASPWRISFVESSGTSPGSLRLMRRDVTLVNGVPTGSNTQTLVSINTPANLSIRGQAWSPSATTPEIAFIMSSNGLTATSTYEIRLVSPSGGSTTTLFSSGPGFCANHLSWSPDGSKIAVYDGDYSGWLRQIRIIDRGTGQVIDTVAGGVFENINGLEWSPSGGTIAFGATPTSGTTQYVYTVDLAGTRTPVQRAAGYRPSWSADGAYIAHQANDGIRKLTLSSSASTLLYAGSGDNTSFGYPNWRR